MSSAFSMFEAAKSGLNVAMQNLSITGHNIANANTKGYSRQRLMTSAKEIGTGTYLLQPLTAYSSGQGVEVLDTQQIRSDYLDSQYRELNTGYSYNEYRTQALEYAEGLFNSETKDGEGLTGAIEDFYKSLNNFTSDTTSEENRVAVQQTAEGLTEDFNLVYGEMESLWEDQNDSIGLMSKNINDTAKKIADINDTIAVYELGGNEANDLRDKRNLLLDTLAGYVNCSYNINESNPSMIDVKIGDLFLVSGNTSSRIEVNCAAIDINNITKQIAGINLAAAAAGGVTNDQITALQDLTNKLSTYITADVSHNSYGGIDVSYKGVSLVSGSNVSGIEEAVKPYPSEWANLKVNRLTLNGSELSIDKGNVTGGELYAHMEMVLSTNQDTPGLPYYMDQLNGLARQIGKNINDVHLTGYSYDTDNSTTTTTSKKGIYFFNVDKDTDLLGNVTEHYERVTAGNFSVGKDIEDSVWNIAGSTEQVYSDGKKMSSGNEKSAQALYDTLSNNGYYSKLNSMVGHLAITLDTSHNMLDAKQSLLKSVDTQRTSISGVSIDEETANLIVYQQTYKACSRVISTINDMLGNLMNMI